MSSSWLLTWHRLCFHISTGLGKAFHKIAVRLEFGAFTAQQSDHLVGIADEEQPIPSLHLWIIFGALITFSVVKTLRLVCHKPRAFLQTIECLLYQIVKLLIGHLQILN